MTELESMVENLDKIGNELYNKFGTDSYNIRCELHDIKEQLTLTDVSQQRELLLAYHKYLDSLNDPTVYNASESMIDDYLANNALCMNF